MLAEYIEVWKLHGANKLAEGYDDTELAALESPAVKATITTDPEPYFFHIDRSAALRVQLLKGLFAPGKKSTLMERLATETETIRKNRTKQTKAGVFIVFEGKTDINISEFKARQDTHEFGVCLDSFDKTEIREVFRPFIEAHLTALGINLKENIDHRVQKIGNVMYIIDPETDKPIYAFTSQVRTARVSITSTLTPDVITQAAFHAPHLMRDGTIRRPVNLLLKSLDQSTDELQAFITAFSALEIFIHKTFGMTYQTRWLEIMKHGAPESVGRVFDRLDEVMKDKYNLADKFLIIASVLDDAAADTDAAEFRRLKKIRDQLLHALDSPPHLPIEATQRLLLKYMKLHLERQPSG